MIRNIGAASADNPYLYRNIYQNRRAPPSIIPDETEDRRSTFSVKDKVSLSNEAKKILKFNLGVKE